MPFFFWLRLTDKTKKTRLLIFMFLELVLMFVVVVFYSNFNKIRN